ncbi:MAG TPA: hypothetical protein VK177_20075 [Flavobacteriales bacterium]|nr:hypothetical protein [Flavobacteriales bacterium]
MKKRALLIGAPGGVTSRFLHGVSKDLDNFRTFLMAPQGGAWLEEEILEFGNPTLDELNEVFQGLHADYTIVYVSGDGSTDNFGRRLAHLSNGDTFADTDFLALDSPRLLVIMDTNRKATHDDPKFIPQWHRQTADQLDFAREMYNEWVSDSEEGKLIIHSTDHLYEAKDSSQGGAFTSALLYFGIGLKPDQNECTFASIKRIGDITVNMIRKHENPQKPYIAYRKGNARLPFAMGVPDRVPTKKKEEKSDAASGASGPLLMSLLLAGLFFLGD